MINSKSEQSDTRESTRITIDERNFNMSDSDSKEFYAHLHEAQLTDLSDIERTDCIKLGKDSKSMPVIILIPTLTIKPGDVVEEMFRKILLLFILKANEIVNTSYSIVYAHTNIDLVSQYPLIYKFYNILPREYKKNLLKMYVIHPNYGLKMFFEFTRVFLSSKFYNKLIVYESILEFQRNIPPTDLVLPWKFLRKEDEIRGLKFYGKMALLTNSFDKYLGTTKIINICTSFLKAQNALKQKGIFRVAGDEGELQLAKIRLQYADQFNNHDDRIILSSNKDFILIGDLTVLHIKPSISKRPSVFDPKQKTSKHNSINNINITTNTNITTANVIGDSNQDYLPEEIPTSLVIITNVNTVAQILKMSISHLPEPLVTSECYKKLIDNARKFEHSGSSSEWEKQCSLALSQLSFEHLSTLVHLVRFLREVCEEHEINSMDSSNIAIIFAPTIFIPDMIEPMKAVMELKLSKLIVKELIEKDIILQNAMYLYEQRNNIQKFIFENPIISSKKHNMNIIDENTLNNSNLNGIGDLNISDVRNLTDQFSDRLVNQIRTGKISGRGVNQRNGSVDQYFSNKDDDDDDMESITRLSINSINHYNDNNQNDNTTNNSNNNNKSSNNTTTNSNNNINDDSSSDDDEVNYHDPNNDMINDTNYNTIINNITKSISNNSNNNNIKNNVHDSDSSSDDDNIIDEIFLLSMETDNINLSPSVNEIDNECDSSNKYLDTVFTSMKSDPKYSNDSINENSNDKINDNITLHDSINVKNINNDTNNDIIKDDNNQYKVSNDVKYQSDKEMDCYDDESDKISSYPHINNVQQYKDIH